jgi:hypothetical protein
MAVVLKKLLGNVNLEGSGADTYEAQASDLTRNVQQEVVRVNCNTTPGIVDFTLPEIASYNGNYGGTTVIVFDGASNAGANNITVRPGGSDTIEGAATAVISTNDGAIELRVSSETTWVLSE